MSKASLPASADIPGEYSVDLEDDAFGFARREPWDGNRVDCPIVQVEPKGNLSLGRRTICSAVPLLVLSPVMPSAVLIYPQLRG